MRGGYKPRGMGREGWVDGGKYKPREGWVGEWAGEPPSQFWDNLAGPPAATKL